MDDAFEVRAVRAAHALNALVILGTFAAAMLAHGQQPDRVPVHFDVAGLPDRWAEKSWGNTLAVPFVGLAVTAMIYAGAELVGWARRRPALLSLGGKEAFLSLPAELQDPIWRQMKAITYWLAVPQTLVFLAIVVLTPTDGGRLRVWPIFAPIGLVLVLGAVLTVRLQRSVRRAIAAGARGT